MENKKIVIVINNGFVSRSLLKSDFFSKIKEKFSEVILLVPEQKFSFFKDNYLSDQVKIEPIFDISYDFGGRLQKRFFKVLKYSIPTRASKIKIFKALYNDKGKIRSFNHIIYFVITWLSYFFSKFKVWRTTLRFIYKCLPTNKEIINLLKKYNPDVVYARYTSPFVNDFNLELLKAAKKLKIRTVGNIFSWDNIYSKIFITTHSDYLMVPNETVKRDSIKLGDFSEDRVRVIGVPHFDFYFNNELLMPRNDFFKVINADPNKKLIMFAGGLQSLRISYPYFFKLFDKFSKDNNVQFYMRPHPKALFDNELVNLYKDNKNFIFESKGEENWGRSFEFADGDNQLLYNLLAHCDIVISLYSTLIIEAAIFDTPVVSINYDGDLNDTYYYSIKRFKELEHVSNIIKYNAFKMVDSDEEFSSVMKEYLNNKLIDNLGRRAMIESETSIFRGHSALKLAETIYETININ